MEDPRLVVPLQSGASALLRAARSAAAGACPPPEAESVSARVEMPRYEDPVAPARVFIAWHILCWGGVLGLMLGPPPVLAQGSPGAAAEVEAFCDNGIDDDGDGWSDCEDTDCH